MIRAHQERQREIDIQLDLLTIVQRWHEEESPKSTITLRDVRIAFADIIQKVVNGQRTPHLYKYKQDDFESNTDQVQVGSGDVTRKLRSKEQSVIDSLSEIYMQADEFINTLQLAGETDIPQFAQDAIEHTGPAPTPPNQQNENTGVPEEDFPYLLTELFRNHIEKSENDLPKKLQRLLQEKNIFWVDTWDNHSPEQRFSLLSQSDHKHPIAPNASGWT